MGVLVEYQGVITCGQYSGWTAIMEPDAKDESVWHIYLREPGSMLAQWDVFADNLSDLLDWATKWGVDFRGGPQPPWPSDTQSN